MHTSRPVRRKAKRPVVNAWRRLLKWSGRMPWSSLALRGAAIAGLVFVEVAVASLVTHAAGDELTGVILVVMAGLGGAGVVLGPGVALSFRSKGRRRLAWLVVAACFAVSAWNLSSVLATNDRMAVAHAVRSAPTHAADQERLAHLNRMIDALADETGRYGGDEALANYLSERDRLQARLDKADASWVMWAGLPYWLKAFLFHGLVAGFSAAFSVPVGPARKAKGGRKRGLIREDQNVAYAQF